jgi:uncharacterized tellurite resistance protein B-like protein
MMRRLIAKLLDPMRSEGIDTPSTDPHRVPTAALALMITIARADQQVDPRELDAIVAAGKTLFGLPDDTLQALVELAHAGAAAATSLYEFTGLINTHCSPADKYRLIRAMWQVAYADGALDRYEEHFIRKVADLTYVPHLEFIQAKHEVLAS